MTKRELRLLCASIRLMKARAKRLDTIKSQIEALRDAAVLPTTKAIYDAILELFGED